MMRLDIVSIFPEYFAPLYVSLIGKARQRGILDVHLHDLRQWAYDKHRTVDDTPYGGGPGMVMKPEPWGLALDAILGAGSATPEAAGCATPEAGGPATPEAGARPLLVIPTPSGRPFTQAVAAEYAAEPWLIFGCGRYEGIDSRVAEEARTRMRVDEVSIGDYVLAGGEAAVLVMVEAVGRLLPGVLGNAESVADDSFAPGRMETLLEGPVYTKPPEWRGLAVPEILFSGHHAAIARWRRDQALRRTVAHRPEILDPGSLDEHDRQVLGEAGFPDSSEPMAD